AFTCMQHRFQLFQGWQIGPTPQQSDGNFFAPLITALDRLVEIGRVMALFFENFHARIKPLVGVVLVVSDARTENVHEREALVLNGALEHFDHVFLFAAESARHISGTANDCHRDRINRVLNASVWRTLGLHSLDAGGRALGGGSIVDLVVHHDVSEVNVAPHGVNKMIAAYSVTVAVAASANHFQFVVASPDPVRIRECAPMERGPSVSVDVTGKIRRTADAADDADLMRLQPELEQ